jgi:nitroimidazol reductase NimA-like FMN-containing flavoprotein (pyridoxamine 5'-phosphate oxidase superfamily)
MRDAHMEVVDDTECRELLTERHLGRLAIVDWEGPMIFPVNYVFDQDLVIFRTDPGTKLDAATEGELVAFEVDAADEGTRTGWSVVVRGTLAEVTDPAHLARFRALPLYPWAPGDKTRYLCVRPHMVTGRRIKIPDDMPFTTWWR